ncbi:MAG: hypothetical protein ACFB8W_20500, partial [Elainellaceae cyanobacterium]
MEVDLVETGLNRDCGVRRIERRLERERLLELYDASGLTQAAFARREGLVYSTFVSWLKQRRQKRQAEASSARPDRKTLFHEVTMPSSPAVALEVRFP